MTRTALRGDVKEDKLVLPTVGFSISQGKYCASDKIEKNEMGGACSSDEGEERPVQGFNGET
jgi:hypothetical protein